MEGMLAIALTTHHYTGQQLRRAFRAGGAEVLLCSDPAEVLRALETSAAALIFLDCDNTCAPLARQVLMEMGSAPQRPPVVLLSVTKDKGPLLGLMQDHEIGHIVPKHAVRADYHLLDERQLLVTWKKLVTGDIFGVEKYLGAWGPLVHRATITSMMDRAELVEEFARYLRSLDCPSLMIPEMATVADEFIVNAIVHAPHGPDGLPRYEAVGPKPNLVLEPSEYVEVTWACDGRFLWLAVADRFGRLSSARLRQYIARSSDPSKLEIETKASGAGIGISLSIHSIHHLVYNVQESVRTEAIAGWDLRVPNAREFRQVSKSMNFFWLPQKATST